MGKTKKEGRMGKRELEHTSSGKREKYNKMGKRKKEAENDPLYDTIRYDNYVDHFQWS